MSISSTIDYKLFPTDQILQHPLIQELSEALDLTHFKIPLTIPGKILMAEGNWNNHFYSKDAISNALKNTDWSDRNKSDLFLDHADKMAREWVGEVTNKRMMGNTLLGDLVIHDLPTAIKMQSGKPKFGISPKVKGRNDVHSNEMVDFLFDNFSIVLNPAVKMAYINNFDSNVTAYSDITEQVKSEEKIDVKVSSQESKGGTKMSEEQAPVSAQEKALSEFGEFAKQYMSSHKDASLSDAVTAYTGLDKPQEQVQKSDSSEQLMSMMKELLSKIGGNTVKSEMSETSTADSKLVAIEAKLAGLEKHLAGDDMPDRRSVNAPTTTALDDAKRRYAEAKANPDLAFTNFLKEKIDGGARA